MPHLKGITSLILTIVAIALLTITVDREFINLTPTEGAQYSVVLESETQYKQQFIAGKSPLIRLGLYLAPADKRIPNVSIPITITPEHKEPVHGQIATVFLSADRSAQISFEKPITYPEGSILTAQFEIPKELSGKVRLQTRKVDETFANDIPKFTINGVLQENPAAYQAYYAYKPPFAIQLSILMLGFAIITITGFSAITQTWQGRILYSAAIALAFITPRILIGESFQLLFITIFIALLGMLTMLQQNHGPHAAIIGANMFALSSWFPLQLLSGRSAYSLVALLPIGMYLYTKHKKYRVYILAGMAVIAYISLQVIPYTTTALPPIPGQWGDIFLDPNQLPHSQKIQHIQTSWDNYGAYIGLFNMPLVLLGIAVAIRKKHLKILSITILLAIASLTPLGIQYGIPLQHSVILLVYMFAIITAKGVDSLHLFLGKKSLLAHVLITAITVFALLDLCNVAIATLEYTYLTP